MSAFVRFLSGSVALGDERDRQFFDVEEPAGEGRHEGAGNPGVGFEMQRHAERQALPLHAAIEGAVGAADDPVRREEQSRANACWRTPEPAWCGS